MNIKNSRRSAGIFCLARHEHLAIEAISHRLQFWREHGTQSCGPELPERPAFRICAGLLKFEEVGQRDHFGFHACHFGYLGNLTSAIRKAVEIDAEIER